MGLPSDFSGPFACKNQVKFVSMMEMARDHRAGGNLVNVCDHLFVGDTKDSKVFTPFSVASAT
jgi:hypothetical protein